MRKTTFGAVAWVLASGLGLAPIGSAQQPKVNHAQLAVKGGDNLQAEIAAAKTTTWFGYAIPLSHRMTTGGDEHVLYLEGQSDALQIYQKPEDPALNSAMILLRVTAGEVERVQVQEADRELDAGSLPFVWLSGVGPVDSVNTLKSVVAANALETAKAAASKVPPVSTGDRERDRIERDVQREPEREARRIQERGLLAIALTNVPEATAALRSFTAPGYEFTMRDRAAFWLASERGAEGFRAVAELVKSDRDDAFREKLVFDLSLVKGDSRKAAVDVLIAEVKTDSSATVRGRAQFWLSQMAGKQTMNDPRILQSLGDSAQNDPEAAIRKSAVFALSRLPESEGVPKLIQVASTSKDAATRREAIFWLGKSKDPRALDYLEKVVRQ